MQVRIASLYSQTRRVKAPNRWRSYIRPAHMSQDSGRMPSKNLCSRMGRLILQAKCLLKLGTSSPMPDRELAPSGFVSWFRLPQQNQDFTALFLARFQFKEDVKQTVPE